MLCKICTKVVYLHTQLPLLLLDCLPSLLFLSFIFWLVLFHIWTTPSTIKILACIIKYDRCWRRKRCSIDSKYEINYNFKISRNQNILVYVLVSWISKIIIYFIWKNAYRNKSVQHRHSKLDFTRSLRWWWHWRRSGTLISDEVNTLWQLSHLRMS